MSRSRRTEYSNRSACTFLEKMNYDAESPKLDLKLHLSPPRVHPSSHESITSSTDSSPRSSCISLELSPDKVLGYPSSPETSSMILMGCQRCLMYVMLPEEDPKCPKCKSSVLLDFLRDEVNRTLKKRSNA